MSTLAEIEQAAQMLPAEQKQRLVASLLADLRKEGVRLPPPRIYSAEEVASMVTEDEAGGQRFRQGR